MTSIPAHHRICDAVEQGLALDSIEAEIQLSTIKGDAAVWRELAQEALRLLAGKHEECARLRLQNQHLRDELRASRHSPSAAA